MSVESETVYRLQCSGRCGMWLVYAGGGVWDRTARKDNASTFETWDSANEEGAQADWFDGPTGEYAVCTCGNPVLFGRHVPYCRITKPRLVPLCPPCREAEENPPTPTHVESADCPCWRCKAIHAIRDCTCREDDW